MTAQFGELSKMTAQATKPSLRFVRRTRLNPQEYHRHFHKLDEEVIAAVTSREADCVTPLMSKIYLRLVNAPSHFWEHEGVLRFEAELREGKQVKAWVVLCESVGVASATASKALSWMHEQGIIGYFAGKNGVGIRIFLNHAAASIGTRSSKKILEFSPASSRKPPASQNEAAFNDSFAVLDEGSDTDFNSRAPKNGAADKTVVDKISPEPKADLDTTVEAGFGPGGREVESPGPDAANLFSVDQIVRRLKAELEPSLLMVAQQAARREHERTREWLENKGLPKAARVAQREAYNVLRNHGVINTAAERARADLDVRHNTPAAEAKPLSAGGVRELAEMCVAMLETHGQSIDTTLAEINSEMGGCLLPGDAPLVRALAESMLRDNDS